MKKMTRKKKPKTQLIYRVLLIVFSLALASLIVVYALYRLDYKEKVLLNSYLNSEKISGKTETELSNMSKKANDENIDNKIKIKASDKDFELSFKDIDWKIDEKKTVSKIYSFGHVGNFSEKNFDFLKSLIVKRNLEFEVTFNEKTVEDWLTKINLEVGTLKKEANLQIKNDDVKIIEPEAGKKIDDEKLRTGIIDLLQLKNKEELKAEIITDEPIIKSEEAKGLEEKAKNLIDKEIEIVGPNSSINLSKNDLGSIIKLKRKVSEKKSFLKSQIKLGEVYVSFDEDKIRKILERNLEQLNKSSVDAKFNISSGKIELKTPSESGTEIILDQSSSELVDLLERGEKNRIVLPTREQKPSIEAKSTADIQKFGVKELVATATTDFLNSPQNRVHNIKTGVQYLSGSLIKSGEEFSTIQRLGSIDQSTGYLPELVIKEDQTIPEFGGGLCQVSTTLFRAAMNAGLDITERKNHTYRVSYYEPPVGMDATIYSPKPDFKFVNNTKSYLLIYGFVDGMKITFEIYGTKDGRVVEITQPEIYDITAPPEPIYIDDPSLEPGEEKRIDRAHSGAKAVFYYRVKKDGKLIIDQKFFSSYVSWPAKYLRGPAKQEGN